MNIIFRVTYFKFLAKCFFFALLSYSQVFSAVYYYTTKNNTMLHHSFISPGTDAFLFLYSLVFVRLFWISLNVKFWCRLIENRSLISKSCILSEYELDRPTFGYDKLNLSFQLPALCIVNIETFYCLRLILCSKFITIWRE